MSIAVAIANPNIPGLMTDTNPAVMSVEYEVDHIQLGCTSEDRQSWLRQLNPSRNCCGLTVGNSLNIQQNSKWPLYKDERIKR
ncbi:hypothetical protein GCM10025859_35270 [Alicyclobacillus fastidiosus]|nr:hypothetical protein GCM10025859_35270 [Alicyclobacillus fastidiosus]